jgi:hypothetical protein
MVHVLQDGLDIGVPYSVANYPSSLDPATGGCRNIAGRNNGDGSVTIHAITSTISNNGDNGADPNKLVKITDDLDAATLPSPGSSNGKDSHERFVTIREAARGEVFRGVAFAPSHGNNYYRIRSPLVAVAAGARQE